MAFELTDEQREQFIDWKRSHKEVYEGPIGGRYTFCFTPTSIGAVVKVKDNVTGEEVDLSDYDLW